MRRIRPGPGRHARESRRQVIDCDRPLRAHRLGQGPGATLARYIGEPYVTRGALVPGHPCSSHESRGLPFVLEQVDQRERNVLGSPGEDLRGREARFLGGLRLGGARAELVQGGDAPLADDFFGDLVHGGEYPADAARGGLIGHRAVGHGEVRFLSEAVPTHLELEILDPGGGSALERRVDERLQHVPDFGPAFPARQPQHLRVLGAEHRTIGIVVNGDVIRSPPKQQREPIGEQEAHHHPKARRPLIGGTQRAARPVVLADERAHLAGAREEGQMGRGCALGLRRSRPGCGQDHCSATRTALLMCLIMQQLAAPTYRRNCRAGGSG